MGSRWKVGGLNERDKWNPPPKKLYGCDLPRSSNTEDQWTGQWTVRPTTIVRPQINRNKAVSKNFGSYRIYYVGEDTDIPKYVEYRKNSFPLTGDWICDSHGVVAQVILMGIHNHPNYRIARGRLHTAFGIDSVNIPELTLIRPRASYSAFAGQIRVGLHKRYLSYKDKAFLMLLVMKPDDPYQVCQEVYRMKFTEPSDKYRITRKIVNIVSHPDAKEFMTQRIHEILQQDGVTREAWVKKLVSSTSGDIVSPTQLNMWMILGKLIPDIREALSEGDTSGGKEIAGFNPKGEVSEAEYRDVCRVCGNKGTYEAPVNGDFVTVPCPLCSKKLEERNSPASDKEVQEPAVQERPDGLRV